MWRILFVCFAICFAWAGESGGIFSAQADISTDPITLQINTVYREVLGRDADATGMETFRHAMETGGKDLQWVRQALEQSEEARRLRYAGRKAARNGLTLIGIWGCMTLVCISIGWIFLRVATNHEKENALPPDVFQLFWAGMGLVMSLGFWWSLFMPIRTGFALLLLVLALAGAASFIRTHALRFTGFRPVGGGETMMLLLAFAGVIFIFVIQTTAIPFAAYDTRLYHWSAVRWLRTYSAVPGLANLHIRLGTNSAWFILAAAVEQGAFQEASAWILPGYFPMIIWSQMIYVFFRRSGQIASQRIRLFVLALLPYGLRLMQETGPGLYFDDAAQCALLASFIAFAHLWSRIEAKQGWKNIPLTLWLSVAFPLTLSFVIKPIGAVWLAVFGVMLLLRGFTCIRKSWVPLCLFAVGPGLLLAGWMLRNAVLTGWLLFPAPLGRLPVDWTVPEYPTGETHAEVMQSVRGQREVIRAWAIEPSPGFQTMKNARTANWFRP
jgi:hypothetical protein